MLISAGMSQRSNMAIHHVQLGSQFRSIKQRSRNQVCSNSTKQERGDSVVSSIAARVVEEIQASNYGHGKHVAL